MATKLHKIDALIRSFINVWMFLKIRFIQCVCRTWSLLVIFCSNPLLTVYKTICIVFRWKEKVEDDTRMEKVEDDTRMGRTGYISSLMDHCLFRYSCWTEKQQSKHESDHPFEHTFPISFILLNQKAKGRHFTPTVCLMRMPECVT